MFVSLGTVWRVSFKDYILVFVVIKDSVQYNKHLRIISNIWGYYLPSSISELVTTACEEGALGIKYVLTAGDIKRAFDNMFP